MSNYTRGPWSEYLDEVTGKYLIQNTSIQPFGEDIAYGIKSKFDANLVASAPELLDLLKECYDVLNTINEETDGPMAMPSPLMQRIEETISKAEGK